MKLRGILPILFIPFDAEGAIDEDGLRRLARFELEGGVHGLGINGFASEAYKLTDDERRRAVEIVATEVAGEVPLIIGIAPGSTEAAISQAREFARYQPAALMTLPPATMDNGPEALVDHYVALGRAVDTPIMVQQSPHIPCYRHCGLSAEDLAGMAERSPNILYFKIEGPGAPERVKALVPLIDTDRIGLFGGGGGITFLEELRSGASGLIPGVGFNDLFLKAWATWEAGDADGMEQQLRRLQPLVAAVSGSSHEYSIHARKYLLMRAGIISNRVVRRPTVPVTDEQMEALGELADQYGLRISLPAAAGESG